MSIDWRKHKAIVFENDDWCGNGIITLPDRETYERACRKPEVRAVLDHLNGVYFIDRISPIKRKLLKKQLKAISDTQTHHR